MTIPATFASATPRFGLPLLFSGQAQKEFFVNEAHVLLDALVHARVHGTADIPPPDPVEGEAWLVQPSGQGDWSGNAQSIAVFTAGGWRFIPPQPGMRVFDSASGRQLHFDDSWKFAADPGLPTGGTTVDLEARAAIGQLVAALRELGLFARTPG